MRPYQDTGLAVFNHLCIHEHTNKQIIAHTCMDALVSLVQFYHAHLRVFTQCVAHLSEVLRSIEYL